MVHGRLREGPRLDGVDSRRLRAWDAVRPWCSATQKRAGPMIRASFDGSWPPDRIAFPRVRVARAVRRRHDVGAGAGGAGPTRPGPLAPARRSRTFWLMVALLPCPEGSGRRFVRRSAEYAFEASSRAARTGLCRAPGRGTRGTASPGQRWQAAARGTLLPPALAFAW